MKLYNHLQPKDAKIIITLANQGFSAYKIAKDTGLNKDKILRCLKQSLKETRTINKSQPWKGPHIKRVYIFKQWKNQRDWSKVKRGYTYAQHAEVVYLPFINFCKNLYDKKILGRKIKRSADEFIKEFKKAHPNQPYPSKRWIYMMAKSENYLFNHKWLPHTKQKVFSLKSEHERLKAIKYQDISKRPPKDQLRNVSGNFEIDSVIGKRTDKTALLTLIDIATGQRYAKKYDRTMKSFKDALSKLIQKHNIKIETLTMDNGGENNLLHEIINWRKMFNCRPYCSGEKGTIEQSHRLIRRVIPKGRSLDNYSDNDIDILMEFTNNYYSKRFNVL